MFCCPSLIGGLVLLIVFLVFLAQSKKSRRLKNSVSALRDKANSWDDTEITDFDPRTKIREEDFNDMTGIILSSMKVVPIVQYAELNTVEWHCTTLLPSLGRFMLG